MYLFMKWNDDNEIMLKDMKYGTTITVSLAEFKELCIENKVCMHKPTDLDGIAYTGIFLYVKTELDIFLKLKLDGISESRDFVQQLKVSNESVVALSGIRRVGITIGLLQYVKYLQHKGASVCYVSLLKDIPYSLLLDFLNERCSSYDYVCIDNITRCYNFVNEVESLTDFALKRKQVVIAGTDSLSLDLVLNLSLYNCITYINIPVALYSEYARILRESFKSYAKVLFLYNRVELNFEAIREFLEIVLCRNIVCTLSSGRFAFKEYILLYHICCAVIKQSSIQYKLKSIIESLPDYDIKQKEQLLEQVNDITLARLVHDTMGIKFDPCKMVEAENWLRAMHILLEVPNILGSFSSYSLIAIQGINYFIMHESIQTLRQLCCEEKIPVAFDCSVLEYVCKDVVILNLLKMGYETYVCRNEDSSFVIDIVVKKGEVLYFLEVKGYTRRTSSDFEYLRDTDTISKYFGDIPYKKFVLYLGNTENKPNDCYINIEDFLLDTKRFIQ